MPVSRAKSPSKIGRFAIVATSALASACLFGVGSTRAADAPAPMSSAPIATPSASAVAPSPVITQPDNPHLRGWGDGGLLLTERFGRLSMSSPERGAGGAMRGAGVEAHVMLPIGWGGYYRWTTWTQDTAPDPFRLGELAMGLLRRIHSTGDSGSFVRTQSRLGIGFLYGSVDTNEHCSQSYAPFTASCETLSFAHPINISGTSLGLELRLQLEMSFGPIALGVDVGAAGYRRVSTGGSSASPPDWMFAPSATLTAGIVLPYTNL